jgi:hypothetical protein
MGPQGLWAVVPRQVQSAGLACTAPASACRVLRGAFLTRGRYRFPRRPRASDVCAQAGREASEATMLDDESGEALMQRADDTESASPLPLRGMRRFLACGGGGVRRRGGRRFRGGRRARGSAGVVSRADGPDPRPLRARRHENRRRPKPRRRLGGHRQEHLKNTGCRPAARLRGGPDECKASLRIEPGDARAVPDGPSRRGGRQRGAQCIGGESRRVRKCALFSKRRKTTKCEA